MFDRGLFITSQAIRRQLAAMPNQLYLIRLIHHRTKQPFPGQRLWTAGQLMNLAIIRFLRARNREGCDVYVYPYGHDHNSGYILVDLDDADFTVLGRMRTNGHEPCVVVQTSPGHLQAWIYVSSSPLPPLIATRVGRHLAQLYGGDRASTDWRHLGRLAGFTNQKPHRRAATGYAPWVKLLYAAAGLATRADTLLQVASQQWRKRSQRSLPATNSALLEASHENAPSRLSAAQAQRVYQSWIRRWHIQQRFQAPDWSIVDLWVARALLEQGMPAERVQEVLHLGSPAFPRGHSNPADYLRRTLAHAFPVFPPAPPVCAVHAGSSTGGASDRSNSAGE